MVRFLFLFLLLPSINQAQLTLARIFSDNMVIQRDRPIQVWGTGVPGRNVRLTCETEIGRTIVKSDSTWSITLAPRKANKEGISIQIISGNEKTELKNILFGDVWLCLGQSNMEWPIEKEKHYMENITTFDQPCIRFYNPTYAGKNVFGERFTDSVVQRLNDGRFYEGRWQNSDTLSVKKMSAVGFYFGKMIYDTTQVAIGLINLSIGGCPIETFISQDAMRSERNFNAKVRGNWLVNDALPIWTRQRGNQNVGNNPSVFSNSIGPNHGYKPGFAYQNGILPILKLAIKGIIWYQGESNAQEIDRVDEYAALMKLMIDDYRKNWKQPTLPFYWVQLSSIDTISYKSQLWPQFRDEQRKALGFISNSGMAVCSDVGDRNSVHPTDKKTVGERLARWALNNAYGYSIIPSGPLPISTRYENNRLIVSFMYSQGLSTADKQSLRGFSIDGKNEIPAIIQNDSVVIETSEKPRNVFYGWKPFTNANLVNGEGFPASTFRIEVK